MSNTDPTHSPSQLHGHATYVAGAAKAALGLESGAQDKEYAVKEMRAAKEQSEAATKNETVGKVEEMLGGATGCEGMVGEGRERQG